MSYSTDYLMQTIVIAHQLPGEMIEMMVEQLVTLKMARGRLFVLGLGGSAANASHAVNDFRKICRIDAIAPTDNVAELTARINDQGWDYCLSEWLKASECGMNDEVLVLSVGGGDLEKYVSPCLVHAMRHAQRVGADIYGIVASTGGETLRLAKTCIRIPTESTPHAEEFQSVILHLIISHPRLQW